MEKYWFPRLTQGLLTGEKILKGNTVDKKTCFLDCIKLQGSLLQLRLEARIITNSTQVEFTLQLNDSLAVLQIDPVDSQVSLVKRIVETGFTVVLALR